MSSIARKLTNSESNGSGFFLWRQQASLQSGSGLVKASPAALIRAALDWFEAVAIEKKKDHPTGGLFWWRQQDSNL